MKTFCAICNQNTEIAVFIHEECLDGAIDAKKQLPILDRALRLACERLNDLASDSYRLGVQGTVDYYLAKAKANPDV
jgi:hypothetical protein